MKYRKDFVTNSSSSSYICGICRMCPICQFIEYSESDLAQYLLKEYQVSRDTVFAEVKKFNKRRKKLYDSEYITYVCQQYNLVPAEIVSSWKEKFGTYDNFKTYLNSHEN